MRSSASGDAFVVWHQCPDRVNPGASQSCKRPRMDGSANESVHKEIDQDRGPPHQTHIIAPIGILQTALEVFDSGATELYPDAHGCILLLGSLAIVL